MYPEVHCGHAHGSRQALWSWTWVASPVVCRRTTRPAAAGMKVDLAYTKVRGRRSHWGSACRSRFARAHDLHWPQCLAGDLMMGSESSTLKRALPRRDSWAGKHLGEETDSREGICDCSPRTRWESASALRTRHVTADSGRQPLATRATERGRFPVFRIKQQDRFPFWAATCLHLLCRVFRLDAFATSSSAPATLNGLRRWRARSKYCFYNGPNHHLKSSTGKTSFSRSAIPYLRSTQYACMDGRPTGPRMGHRPSISTRL
ncbi:hypothetical protein KC361_g283 [Hortaea werneckii]|nr:hypothetical protein KC361_g283 [Hortaea werneckii]